MKEDSLTYRTLHNSAYSFFGFVFPIIFTIFITPVVVRELGVVTYGFYVLLTTVSAFLGILDFGLGNALVKHIAAYAETKDVQRLNRFLGSARLLYTGIGFLGLGVFFALGQWFLVLFHVPTSNQAETMLVCVLAGLVFLINCNFSVYGVVPAALQRFDVTVKLNLLQLAVLQIAVLFLVLGGFKLQAILAVNVLVAVLSGMTFWYYSRKLLPGAHIRYQFAWAEVKEAYRFGFLSSIAALSINTLTYLDRMIIPIFAGPAAVAYYSLPGNIALKVPGVTNSLTAMVFPMVSSMQAAASGEKIAQVYVKIFRNVTVIAAALAVTIAVFAEKLLLFWLGADFAAAGHTVLVVLAFTNFCLALYTALYSFLLGLGRLKVLVGFSLCVVVLNVILLFALVPGYGIMGAAWAYFFSVLPVGVLFWWVERQYLGLRGRLYFYVILYSKILFVSGVYWLLAKYLLLPLVQSLFTLIVIGSASVGLYMLLYILFGFLPPDDKEAFKRFFFVSKQKLFTRYGIQ